ncbi:MAG TPA: formylglycine-generating enzyme family protein [Candidatus Krumholzibacteria bacterium]|nr:formylglycine-generating enzyme family protein [Candidatus Krumholzibacteria bacterium]
MVDPNRITARLGILACLFVTLAGCDSTPTGPSGLEDFGVEPAVVIAGSAGYVPAGPVSVSLTAVGADSCAVWNVTPDGIADRATPPLVDGRATLPAWALAPGEGPQVVQAMFWGHGGAASAVVSDTIIVDATPPVPAGVIFPADPDDPVNTTVKLQWQPFTDSWCDASALVYRVEAVAGGQTWSTGFDGDRHAVLDGLPRETQVEWQVVCRDPAGNESTAAFAPFVTWSVVLPDFVAIPAGTFTMGSPLTEPGRSENEVLHDVELTRGYSMASTQLTYGAIPPLFQWAFDHGLIASDQVGVRDAIDGSAAILWRWEVSLVLFDGATFSLDPRISAGALVSGLSWYGAAALTDWLNAASGFAQVHDRTNGWQSYGDVYAVEGYRLPTEAEWEYACRAGTQTAFWNGELEGACCTNDPGCCCESPTLAAIGYYCANASGFGFPAQKPANPWGLYDMHGGYADFCYDTYSSEYPAGAAVDPVVFDGSGANITRGADNWVGAVLAQGCRAARRGEIGAYMTHLAGARLVRSGLPQARFR